MKNAKISPKISEIHEKPPNERKIHMNFHKPSNHYQNQPKIKTNKKNCFKNAAR